MSRPYGGSGRGRDGFPHISIAAMAAPAGASGAVLEPQFVGAPGMIGIASTGTVGLALSSRR